MIFENLGNNFLRERLVAEIIEDLNGTSSEEMLETISDIFNVHDPRFRNGTIEET